jgi:outer membrane protein OmpA-like peptidoglycan-associated protein
MISRSLTFVSALLICGCSWQWPKDATGGAAERGRFSTPYEERLAKSNAPVSRTAETDLWRTRLMVNKQRADLLRTEGAATYFPAITDDITLQYKRSMRELEGGLPADAINSALQLEQMLDALERRMVAIGKHGQEIVREPVAPRAQPNPPASPSMLEEALLQQGVTIKRGTKNSVHIGIDARALFDINSAQLKPLAQDTLSRLASVLNAHTEVVVAVAGHTDAQGSLAKNAQLSQARANAVRDFLVRQGVASARIQPLGLGEQHPIATNETKEGRYVNRRVDVWLAPGMEKNLEEQQGHSHESQ